MVAVEHTGPDDQTPRIGSAATDDRAEFAAAYQRYLQPVYRYCYLRLGSREAAEDAASEVFTRAFEDLTKRCACATASWLFAVAHNVVIDAIRRRRPVEPLDTDIGVPDGGVTPEDAAVQQAERMALRRAIGRLSADQQTVVELRLAGWAGSQIAEAVGKSPAAVKMLQLRAIQRLRSLLLTSSAEEAKE